MKLSFHIHVNKTVMVFYVPMENHSLNGRSIKALHRGYWFWMMVESAVPRKNITFGKQTENFLTLGSV